MFTAGHDDCQTPPAFSYPRMESKRGGVDGITLVMNPDIPSCTEEREELPPHSTSTIVVYEPQQVVKAKVVDVGSSRHSSY
ncbi:hypothetical protein ACOSQ3_004662 [Xanthoceras sorbifolium]